MYPLHLDAPWTEPYRLVNGNLKCRESFAKFNCYHFRVSKVSLHDWSETVYVAIRWLFPSFSEQATIDTRGAGRVIWRGSRCSEHKTTRNRSSVDTLMRVLHGCGDNRARNRRLANLACMCPERITMCDRTFFGIQPYNFHRRCCCVFNSMKTRSGLNQFRFAGISALCSSLHLQSAEMKKFSIRAEKRIIAFFYHCLYIFFRALTTLDVK